MLNRVQAWIKASGITAAHFVGAIALSIVCGGSGGVIVYWIQGGRTRNAAALVGLASTIVAVIGWYKSSQLNATNQRQLLHLGLLNESRIVLVRAIRHSQAQVRKERTIAFALHFVLPPPDGAARMVEDLTDFLCERPQWKDSMDEHIGLFPEVQTCVKQLAARWEVSHKEVGRLRDALKNPAGLPPEVRAESIDVGKRLISLEGLFQDLIIHIQNRTFAELTGKDVPLRAPTDLSSPVLRARDDGQLVIQEPTDSALTPT